MSVETFVPTTPIQVTQNAVNKVNRLTREEGNPNLKLRIFITGGGCSGFQYGLFFAGGTGADDNLIERDGAVFLGDPMSFQ